MLSSHLMIFVGELWRYLYIELYVAKSYQGLPVVEEPYKKGGKTYCKVRTPKGVLKEVRVYSQKEYEKMYPAPEPKWKPQRELLGFGEDGFILIFNNKPEFETFYEKGPFRYHRECLDGICLAMRLCLRCYLASCPRYYPGRLLVEKTVS